MEEEVKKEYELALLINNEIAESTLDDFLAGAKVAVLHKEPAKLITLAYPIKKQKSAIMLVYQISVDPEQIDGLKKNLNFQPNVLRFLIIKFDAKKKSKAKNPTPTVIPKNGVSSNELLAKTLEQLETEEAK